MPRRRRGADRANDLGKRASSPIAATFPAAPETPRSTLPAATLPANLTLQTYGQLLHADIAGYPETRPWGVPVDLADAAHVILQEPIYVCSRRDLWITRKDADTLQTVLARVPDETEHIVDCPVRYVVWAPSPRGVWAPSVICPRENGLALVSATKEQKLPASRPYDWAAAMTWDDGGHTRLIVPAGTGVSIFTLGSTISESYMDLGATPPTTFPGSTQPLQAANSQPTTMAIADTTIPSTQKSALSAAIPAPQIVFDLKGVLAWIPSDAPSAGLQESRDSSTGNGRPSIPRLGPAASFIWCRCWTAACCKFAGEMTTPMCSSPWCRSITRRSTRTTSRIS